MVENTATRAPAPIDNPPRRGRRSLPRRNRAPKAETDQQLAKIVRKATFAPKGDLIQALLDDLVSSGRRKFVGDIKGLARAIEEVGYLDPILVDAEMRIVDGHRRVLAVRELGWKKIPAVVLDVEDPLLASVSLGTHNKKLAASERYALFEELLGRCADPEYRRRVLGGRLDTADAKGRIDEAISSHVGLSRESLRKIRLILGSAHEDEARFGDLRISLDLDGKVDRHYRELQRRLARGDGEAAKAIVLEQDWTELLNRDAQELAKAVKVANLAARGDRGCLLLIPASVALVSAGAEILRVAGYRWITTLPGTDEGVWLLGVLGKREILDLTIAELVSEGCGQGDEGVALALEAAFGSPPMRITITQESA